MYLKKDFYNYLCSLRYSSNQSIMKNKIFKNPLSCKISLLLLLTPLLLYPLPVQAMEPLSTHKKTSTKFNPLRKKISPKQATFCVGGLVVALGIGYVVKKYYKKNGDQGTMQVQERDTPKEIFQAKSDYQNTLVYDLKQEKSAEPSWRINHTHSDSEKEKEENQQDNEALQSDEEVIGNLIENMVYLLLMNGIFRVSDIEKLGLFDMDKYNVFEINNTLDLQEKKAKISILANLIDRKKIDNGEQLSDRDLVFEVQSKKTKELHEIICIDKIDQLAGTSKPSVLTQEQVKQARRFIDKILDKKEPEGIEEINIGQASTVYVSEPHNVVLKRTKKKGNRVLSLKDENAMVMSTLKARQNIKDSITLIVPDIASYKGFLIYNKIDIEETSENTEFDIYNNIKRYIDYEDQFEQTAIDFVQFLLRAGGTGDLALKQRFVKEFFVYDINARYGFEKYKDTYYEGVYCINYANLPLFLDKTTSTNTGRVGLIDLDFYPQKFSIKEAFQYTLSLFPYHAASILKVYEDTYRKKDNTYLELSAYGEKVKEIFNFIYKDHKKFIETNPEPPLFAFSQEALLDDNRKDITFMKEKISERNTDISHLKNVFEGFVQHLNTLLRKSTDSEEDQDEKRIVSIYLDKEYESNEDVSPLANIVKRVIANKKEHQMSTDFSLSLLYSLLKSTLRVLQENGLICNYHHYVCNEGGEDCMIFTIRC